MSAGFRITPSGQSTKTHVLEKPLAFEPAPGHRKRRFPVDSLDLSAHEVTTIAPGRAEVEATLKFNRKGQDLLDFLELAADGRTITYYPDLSVDTSYDLWLIGMGDVVQLDPQSGRWPLGDYEVRVRFRDASASGQSLEALFSPWLFRYDAGMVASDATFTRTDTATQIGQFGVRESAADGVLRDGHWLLVNGEREVSTLIENARTNLVLQSEDFGTTWSTVGTPTRSAAAHTASGVTLDLIGDDDGSGSEYYTQTVTFTSDGSRTVSIHAKEGESPNANGSQIILRDTTDSVSRLIATVTWSSGVPSVSMGAGTEVQDPELLTDGVYRLHLRASGVVAANTNQIQVRPTTSTSSETGDIYAGGVQAENSTLVSSYIPTTTSTETRNAETLYLPFRHAPQAMTIYVRFRARMVSGSDSGAAVLHIGGATAGDDPRLVVFDGPNGYRVAHDNGDTAVTSPDTLTAVSVDDEVELRVMLNADGSVALGQSIDGGAEEVTADSSANPLKDAWADERIYIGSAGTSDRGLNAFHEVLGKSGDVSLTKLRAA